MSRPNSSGRRGWPRERVLFALAGSVPLLTRRFALRAAADTPPTSEP